MYSHEKTQANMRNHTQCLSVQVLLVCVDVTVCVCVTESACVIVSKDAEPCKTTHKYAQPHTHTHTHTSSFGRSLFFQICGQSLSVFQVHVCCLPFILKLGNDGCFGVFASCCSANSHLCGSTMSQSIQNCFTEWQY